MKNKKIMSIILAAGMVLSTMSMAVSARANETVSAETIQIYDDYGRRVGTGEFEAGSSRAYASCQKVSGNSYTHAACRLRSYTAGDDLIDSQTGYAAGSASTFVTTGSDCSYIDGMWAIYIPVNGQVPAYDPRYEDTFYM